jgi:hypothetical protein
MLKHCHISIICNELVFLKRKLPFLYQFFDQIIFIDYDIFNNTNSNDGSIEYIENFNDTENKIILIKDYYNKDISGFNGVSMIEKQQMFSVGSKYIKDNMDVIWATDADEFFDYNLINEIDNLYQTDKTLISVDIPHIIFFYNQYNQLNNKNFYICPRITKHFKNKIYGHCNFQTYGKTIKLQNNFLLHFAYVGYNKCKFKLDLYNRKSNEANTKNNDIFLDNYKKCLKNNEIKFPFKHPNPLILNDIIYEPNIKIYDYIDVDNMCKELNNLNIL